MDRHGPFLAASSLARVKSKPRTLVGRVAWNRWHIVITCQRWLQAPCPPAPPQPLAHFCRTVSGRLRLTKVYLYPHVDMPQFNGFSSYFWYFVVVAASSQLATDNWQLATGTKRGTNKDISCKLVSCRRPQRKCRIIAAVASRCTALCCLALSPDWGGGDVWPNRQCCQCFRPLWHLILFLSLYIPYRNYAACITRTSHDCN